MKSILILQHLSDDGPSYLATWLARHGVPFDVRNSEAGGVFPDRLDGHGGLAILGGAMSANDPLPSLRQAERLIRQAVASGVPVLGHCLGGQLMSRALGGRVQASPAPEIGWLDVELLPTPTARSWFGDARQATVCQWHFEAFDLPAGAERLATSAACPNQAFALGPHLGLQFHVEVDADKAERWSREVSASWEQACRQHPSTVQDGTQFRAGTHRHLARQQAMADRLYARWLAGVATA